MWFTFEPNLQEGLQVQQPGYKAALPLYEWVRSHWGSLQVPLCPTTHNG